MNKSTAVLVAGVCLLAFFVQLEAQGQGGIRRVDRPIRGRYIVVLRGADDPLAVGLETANVSRGRLRHVYERALRGFAIELPEPAARALANDPRVEFVEEDGEVTASALAVQGSATWGLDRIDQRALPLDTSYSYSHDGSGIHVHVIDTGIRVTHAEFGGRAAIAGDYVDDDFDGDPYDVGNDDANTSVLDGSDCHGHGTHVAGTIGGATYGVAKQVTLWGHRVLDCSGSGSTSGVIAAVDAITADPRRPAVANMSLGGSVSFSLDWAVRQSIASGVTYVVAAGNSNVDAATSSPARVTEAITVGATSSSDARASFSNYGASLDLFAPGVSIRAASHGSDTGTTTMSGTSMAAPHVAGVAALYLNANPDATAAAVHDALVAATTPGIIVNPGTGSPNRLLYSLTVATDPADVDVVSPNGGEKVFTASAYTIRWTAENVDSAMTFDVQASSDNGISYVPVVGCTALPSEVRQCTWAAPGPATSAASIRVVVRQAAAELAADASDAAFTLVSGTPTLTVTSPNTAVNWGRGSTQVIRWKHNLGAKSSVRIEVSRDGGATYSDVAGGVSNTTATAGEFRWTVPAPNTSSARIRVSWSDGAAADVSDASFTIADPYVTVRKPAKGANWGYGTTQRPEWQTNLGPDDQIELQLSVDGGVSFPTPLASAAATARAFDVVTPTLAVPTAAARIRAVWVNAPAGAAATGTSPANFTVEPPFVRITAANGGETWVPGTNATVRWQHNLGLLEFVRIELSHDGGSSYPTIVSARTKSDGTHAVAAGSTWVTPSARLRIMWLEDTRVSDESDATFQISTP